MTWRRARPLMVAAGLMLCCASWIGAQQKPRVQPDTAPRAARVLPRGTVIHASDVMVLGDSLPRALPLGWITRRVVQLGEPLRPPAIGRAPIINSGTRVTISAGGARVAITRSGTALADGALGDTIPVRVDRTSTISAIVRDSLTVVPVSPSRP